MNSFEAFDAIVVSAFITVMSSVISILPEGWILPNSETYYETYCGEINLY
jgi:hypothetical protein